LNAEKSFRRCACPQTIIFFREKAYFGKKLINIQNLLKQLKLNVNSQKLGIISKDVLLFYVEQVAF